MVLYKRPEERVDRDAESARAESAHAGPARPNAGQASKPAAGAPVPRIFITPALIALNVGIFATMVALGVSPTDPAGEDLITWGSNAGPWTLSGEWWRLVSSMFLHAGALHVGLNMWVLWNLGRTTERVFGSLGFALVYLAAGVGGSFASVLVHPNTNSVGASGAIFGIAGAFLAFLLRNRDRLDPVVLRTVRGNLLQFVLLNIAIGFAIPMIDQSAHVGGLITGFVAGLFASPRLVPGSRPVRPVALYPVVIAIVAMLCGLVASGLLLPR